jgi:hypothetical protein
MAKRILGEFILEGSPREINIDGSTMRALRSATIAPFKDGMFNDAQAQVLDTMRQASFSRFLETSFFDLMVKGLEMRQIVVHPTLLASFEKLCVDDNANAWTRKKVRTNANGQECFVWNGAKADTLIIKTRVHIDRDAW